MDLVFGERGAVAVSPRSRMVSIVVESIRETLDELELVLDLAALLGALLLSAAICQSHWIV